MRILATISDMQRVAVLLAPGSGGYKAIPIRPEFIDDAIDGRPPCRPFGITWNSHELFFANNHQLLVFDRELEFLRTSPTRLQTNVHQMAYHAGRVWVVSPWTNSLIGVPCNSDAVAVEVDLCLSRVRPYAERNAVAADDRLHFNSLLWTDVGLYVAAHAFGDGSFINRYDPATWRLIDVRHDVGASIHGLALCEGELFWLSTGTREIRSDQGYRHKLSRRGYARGFAVTREHFVVAISEFLARGERQFGDSWIQLIERRSGRVVSEDHLPKTGSINDLRILDECDYAHSVDPFWGVASV